MDEAEGSIVDVKASSAETSKTIRIEHDDYHSRIFFSFSSNLGSSSYSSVVLRKYLTFSFSTVKASPQLFLLLLGAGVRRDGLFFFFLFCLLRVRKLDSLL